MYGCTVSPCFLNNYNWPCFRLQAGAPVTQWIKSRSTDQVVPRSLYRRVPFAQPFIITSQHPDMTKYCLKGGKIARNTRIHLSFIDILYYGLSTFIKGSSPGKGTQTKWTSYPWLAEMGVTHRFASLNKPFAVLTCSEEQYVYTSLIFISCS